MLTVAEPNAQSLFPDICHLGFLLPIKDPKRGHPARLKATPRENNITEKSLKKGRLRVAHYGGHLQNSKIT
jgi:hypothetical protein